MLYVKDLHKSYQVGKMRYQVLKGIGGDGAFRIRKDHTFKLHLLLYSL